MIFSTDSNDIPANIWKEKQMYILYPWQVIFQGYRRVLYNSTIWIRGFFAISGKSLKIRFSSYVLISPNITHFDFRYQGQCLLSAPRFDAGSNTQTQLSSCRAENNYRKRSTEHWQWNFTFKITFFLSQINKK